MDGGNDDDEGDGDDKYFPLQLKTLLITNRRYTHPSNAFRVGYKKKKKVKRKNAHVKKGLKRKRKNIRKKFGMKQRNNDFTLSD